MSGNSNELNDLINGINIDVVSSDEFVNVVDSSIISVNDEDDTISYIPTGVQIYGYSVLKNKDDEDRYAIRKHGTKTRHIKIEDVLSIYYIDKFIVFQVPQMAMYFNTSTGKLTRKKW